MLFTSSAAAPDVLVIIKVKIVTGNTKSREPETMKVTSPYMYVLSNKEITASRLDLSYFVKLALSRLIWLWKRYISYYRLGTSSPHVQMKTITLLANRRQLTLTAGTVGYFKTINMM